MALTVDHFGGSLVQKAEHWVEKKLSTVVDITYSNGLGSDWGFTRSYSVIGLTLNASIKIGASGVRSGSASGSTSQTPSGVASWTSDRRSG